MLELEKAIKGGPRYWAWIVFLLAVIGAGTLAYLLQLRDGLGITGLSRDVTWGFYIAQFTFLVGVAASGLMVVLPYYLHDYKAFGKITILGEFLAVGAVIMCMTFIFVDMGMPTRVLNVPLYPTPNSIMFWDMLVLGTYLALNLVIAVPMLAAEYRGKQPPYYILKPIIYLSIAWAPLIHTVTAFLYAGLPNRHMWLTAILAARFLASAFCAGPAILVILYLLMNYFYKQENNMKAVGKLAQIICYAMIVNMFFLGLEFFTAFYSGIPGHKHSIEYLFFGLHEHGHTYGALVPFMWTSLVLGVTSAIVLVFPGARRNLSILVPTLVVLVLAAWLDKGVGLIIGGFVPSPLGHITEYSPTLPEVLITMGVFGIGALVITVLYKIVAEVRQAANS